MTNSPAIFNIYDKHGHRYRLINSSEDKDFFLALLWDGNKVVGRLNMKLHLPDELHLCDIILFDSIPPSTTLLRQFLVLLGLSKPKPINYRRHGLGRALLHFVDEQAQNLRVKHIIGEVYHRDYAEWPELLNWYAKHGFTVTPRSDQADPDVVAYIGKELV